VERDRRTRGRGAARNKAPWGKREDRCWGSAYGQGRQRQGTHSCSHRAADATRPPTPPLPPPRGNSTALGKALGGRGSPLTVMTPLILRLSWARRRGCVPGLCSSYPTTSLTRSFPPPQCHISLARPGALCKVKQLPLPRLFSVPRLCRSMGWDTGRAGAPAPAAGPCRGSNHCCWRWHSSSVTQKQHF